MAKPAKPTGLVCNVGKVRRAQKLSQEKLAELTDCTRTQVIRIEHAQVAPGLPLALRMARILGVSVESLWSVPSYSTLPPPASRGYLGAKQP